MTTDTTEAVQAARRIVQDAKLAGRPLGHGEQNALRVARALLSLAERDLIEEAARTCEEAAAQQESDCCGALALGLADAIRSIPASPAPSPPDDTTRLREALQKAAAQFRFYEAEHRRKAEVNGDRAATLRKAETNQKFAEMCEAALIPAPPKGGER